MQNIKYYDRLEDYFNDRLSGEEKQRFELELKTNAELKTEYDAYLATREVIELLAFEQLGTELENMTPAMVKSDLESEEKTAEKTAKKGRVIAFPRRVLSLAAGFLLLILAGTFWWSNAQYGNDALASTYAIGPNLNDLSGRRSEDGGDHILPKAAGLYHQGAYRKVIQELRGLPADGSIYPDIQNLLGHAYLKNDQPAAAVESFKAVLAGNKDQLKPGAQWHLILAQLANGDQPAAEAELDRLLQQPAGPYHAKAKALKGSLDSFWRKLAW